MPRPLERTVTMLGELVDAGRIARPDGASRSRCRRTPSSFAMGFSKAAESDVPSQLLTLLVIC